MSAQVYFDRLPLLLLQYQFIEEGLKMYVVTIEHAIRKALHGYAHYEVNEKDLRRQPLGSLIREFDKRSDRKDIVAAIRAVVEDRNFFAHRGFLLSIEEQNGQTDISDLLVRLEVAHAKAKKCVLDVMVEAARVRGEPLSDDIRKQMA